MKRFNKMRMTVAEATEHLQDASYEFQCLKDQLQAIEVANRNSEQAKSLYRKIDQMIANTQRSGQLMLF